MPGLEETTAMLRRLSRERRSFAAAADAAWRRMTETARFGADPGSLRMLSYVPEGLPPGAPLVVVLHGCTQRAEAHAAAAGWLTLADRYGFAVIAPEQREATTSTGASTGTSRAMRGAARAKRPRSGPWWRMLCASTGWTPRGCS
jgi:feruloyl esterase